MQNCSPRLTPYSVKRKRFVKPKFRVSLSGSKRRSRLTISRLKILAWRLLGRNCTRAMLPVISGQGHPNIVMVRETSGLGVDLDHGGLRRRLIKALGWSSSQQLSTSRVAVQLIASWRRLAWIVLPSDHAAKNQRNRGGPNHNCHPHHSRNAARDLVVESAHDQTSHDGAQCISPIQAKRVEAKE